MKTVKLIIAGVFFLFLSLGVIAQNPPDPPGGHGGDGDVPGGEAPLSGSYVVLLALSGAFGGKKVYDFKKKMYKISE